MLPSQVADMPSSDAVLLEQYWNEEPWGAFRDNLHTALVCREVLRAGGFKVPKLDMFMVRKPPNADKAEKAARVGLVDLFKTIAVKKKRPRKNKR